MTPKQLKTWRRKLNITQSDAADMITVTVRCYQYWEAGGRKIPDLVADWILRYTPINLITEDK